MVLVHVYFLSRLYLGAFHLFVEQRSVEKGRLTLLGLNNKIDKWVEAKWKLILTPMRTFYRN